MTVETKTTIQLSDVKAVEFQCRQCHRILPCPIEVTKEPPIHCDCKTPHWMPVGGEMYCGVMKLIELIKHYGKANNEPFAMRFVVDGLSGPASGGKG